MSLADAAARGAAQTIGAQGVRILIQVSGVVILSRLLSPTDFGLVAMVLAVANIATVLGDFGLSAAAIQATQLSRKQCSNLFWTNATIGLVLTLAVSSLAAPLASFYGRPEIAQLTQAISITFLLNALASQFRAQISRSLRFWWLAVADILAPAVALTVAVIAALNNLGVWALVLQPISLAAMTLVTLACAARWIPGLPGRAPMRSLYTFGAGTLGIQVVTYISTNIDDVLVGRFFGPAATGFYSRAYQLFRLPSQQIATPAGRVLFPVLSRLQNDPAKFQDYFLRAQLLFAYAIGGMFFALAACADPLIDIALGAGWDPAKPVFTALALGGIFQALTFGYLFVFQAKGLVGYQLRFSLIGRTFMVVLLFAGLPFGIIGVACASAAGQAIMWAFYTALAVPRAQLSRRRLVKVAAAPYGLFTAAAAVGLAVSRSADTLAAPAQLGLTLIGFLLVTGCGLAVIPKLRHDVHLIASVAKRALRKN